MTDQQVKSDRSDSHYATLPPREQGGVRVFAGRTGVGLDVVVDEVEAWLDVRYIDSDGNARGFALNPKYAAELTTALVGVIAERAQR